MRRQASRDEESSGTKWDNIFSTKSQRIQEGESTKSARKVITDYAYAYSICTHGGEDGGMDEKLLYILLIIIYIIKNINSPEPR